MIAAAGPSLAAEAADDARLPLADVLQAAVGMLATAGVDSPEHDARALLGHVLGLAPAALAAYLASGRDVSGGDAQRWAELVARRAERVPLQHLTGTAVFRYSELAVGPGVFTPRPETELLVEPALAALRRLERPGVVVDLCSGSGAVALSLASEGPPGTRVVAVEREEAALSWLSRNVAAHAARVGPEEGGGTVRVVAGDVVDVETLLPTLLGRVDVVVANPPYLPEPGWTSLPPEVRDGDPAAALVSGIDGLTTVRAVVGAAGLLLRSGGLFALEHGDDQAGAVGRLLSGSGRWEEVVHTRDLAGRPRFAIARRARGALDHIPLHAAGR